MKPLYIRHIKIVDEIPRGMRDQELYLLDDLSSRPPAMHKFFLNDYFKDKPESAFRRLEELLIFYYNKYPDDRPGKVELDDSVILPVDLFKQDDFRERTNAALSLLYQLEDDFKGKRKVKNDRIKSLYDHLNEDGKRLFSYLLNKLSHVKGNDVLPFVEVHLALDSLGFIKSNELPKRNAKGLSGVKKVEGLYLTNLYKEAFGYMGTRQQFTKQIDKIKDPLKNPGCTALIQELKSELRNIIVSQSKIQK